MRIGLYLTLALAAFFLSGCRGYDGVESNFVLAGEKLPSWCVVDVKCGERAGRISFDIKTSGNVDVVVYAKNGSKKIYKKSGVYKEIWVNRKLVRSEFGQYPKYMEIVVDGKSDVYEQRKPAPLLYVVSK